MQSEEFAPEMKSPFWISAVSIDRVNDYDILQGKTFCLCSGNTHSHEVVVMTQIDKKETGENGGPATKLTQQSQKLL